MVYTLKEAEQRVTKSERTLRRMVKAGKLEAEMKNGQYVLSDTALATLPSRKQATVSTPDTDLKAKELEVRKLEAEAVIQTAQAKMQYAKAAETLAEKQAEITRLFLAGALR